MIFPTYVHIRDSARAAARVDRWLTNGDAPTHARLLRGVAHSASFGRHSQDRLSSRRSVKKKATQRLLQALQLPLALRKKQKSPRMLDTPHRKTGRSVLEARYSMLLTTLI
jgi:hypothetical protein